MIISAHQAIVFQLSGCKFVLYASRGPILNWYSYVNIYGNHMWEEETEKSFNV